MADKGLSARQHAAVVKEILARCGARSDCRLWSNNTGMGRGLSSDSVVRFGLVGSSDLLGIYRGGLFLAIEVKTGRGKQTDAQRHFEAMIRQFGGRYTVVGSPDEAEAWLDELAG